MCDRKSDPLTMPMFNFPWVSKNMNNSYTLNCHEVTILGSGNIPERMCRKTIGNI